MFKLLSSPPPSYYIFFLFCWCAGVGRLVGVYSVEGGFSQCCQSYYYFFPPLTGVQSVTRHAWRMFSPYTPLAHHATTQHAPAPPLHASPYVDPQLYRQIIQSKIYQLYLSQNYQNNKVIHKISNYSQQ